MTRRRRPVNPWLRRSLLVVLLGMTLVSLTCILDGDTVERVLGLTALAGCVALFVGWWRIPTVSRAREPGPNDAG